MRHSTGYRAFDMWVLTVMTDGSLFGHLCFMERHDRILLPNDRCTCNEAYFDLPLSETKLFHYHGMFMESEIKSANRAPPPHTHTHLCTHESPYRYPGLAPETL